MPETNHHTTETESNIGETIERFLGIVKRRRWWILTAGSLIPITVAAIAMRLPSQYISQSTILVVQQQVSQKYVEPDGTANVAAAVQAMKLEVLSPDRLVAIINDLGLYGTNRNHAAPDPLVDRMREDIDIEPLETPGLRNDFGAFTIAFTATTPQLARAVDSRLASLFIEQHKKNQGEKAANTTRFLDGQLDAAKQRLTAQDQRLQAFRANNMGELPEQQSSNLASLTDTRMRIESIASNLSLAQQQQISLEISLSDRLSRLQSEREALLVHYTPKYPEVVTKDQQIAKVQSTLDRLKTGTFSAQSQQGDTTNDPSLDLIIRQAESNAQQTENLLKQQDKLRQEMEQYQARLNSAPLREQQLAAIQRDDDLYKQDYTNLLNSKLNSEMSTSLEENQEGQQFKLVDPPSLPAKPAGPKRLKIALGGLGGGIALGLALAFIFDLRDRSIHSEKALTQSFSLPLVMGVPLVQTRGQLRKRSWRIAFECVAGSVLALAMFAAEFYVFRNS